MRLLTAFVASTVVVFSLEAPLTAQTVSGGAAVSGQIVVKFQPGAAAGAKTNAHRAGGGRVLKEISRTGVQLVEVTAGDEGGAINRYRRNPNVLYAERNFIRSIPKPISNAKLANHAPGSGVIPGDHMFKEQWALHNTGQLFYCFPFFPGEELCFYIGTPDADIDAPEAWAISTGNTVTVGVIDTGIDYTHPDLIQAYAGGVDYVTPDLDPMDDQGHGTHVSGTIAAAINNTTGDPAEEEGVAGVAPLARIRAYKVCDASGNCSDFAIQQAIAQAVADGVKVINMSLGGAEYSQGLDDMVQAAWNAGVVIVAGAGNNGNTGRFYPAALDHVIAVGAFDEDHLRAPFSNYGDWVHIAAPGNVIMSTYRMAACLPSTVPGDIGCYNWLSGTSMATPHVAGAAALVWSRGDVTSNQQVYDILLNSADPVGVSPVRLDSWTNHGGLNLHNALSFGLTNLSPTADAGSDQTLRDNDADGVELVVLDGAASSDSDGVIVDYEWREGSNVLAFEASPSVFLSVGIHTLTLRVTDDDGATGTDTVVVTVNPNLPPVANAGPDQAVTDTNADGSELVLLNGSASSDPDGSVVSYQWLEGATVLATVASASVPLTIGTHTLTLRVTDNDGATATDTVVVFVNANLPPIANAGVDQTVTDADNDGSQLVTLNGAGSSDPDGSIIAYEWRRGDVVIAASASPTLSFAVGTHTLTLRVTDNHGATGTDTVVITVNPFVGPTSAHIGDLDRSTASTGNTWSATVTVAVHNTNHQPVAGARVNGRWNGGAIVSCTTTSAGTCSFVSTNIRRRVNSVTFTVTNIVASGLAYASGQNHDSDGDSNGTAITVLRP
jgi:thermitase